MGKGVMLSDGNLIDNTFCITEKECQEIYRFIDESFLDKYLQAEDHTSLRIEILFSKDEY